MTNTEAAALSGFDPPDADWSLRFFWDLGFGIWDF